MKKLKKVHYLIKLLVLTITLAILISASIAYGQMNKTGLMWEYLEWELDNSSCIGNPYDLIATVTFTHNASGKTHTTQMFYDENNKWKFRFTGTKTGTWRFITSSSDSSLNGHSGTVTISANPNPVIKGFITTYGNKFARQIDENTLEGYIVNVYQNSRPYPKPKGHTHTVFEENNQYIIDLINEAIAHGCNTVFLGAVENRWWKYGVSSYKDHSSDQPDPATFRKIENMILLAHSMGAHVHIWMYGDEDGNDYGTPIGIAGGVNGYAEKRVLRYLAARLGPLPGWTMGRGYDLHEWSPENEVKVWAAYIHQHLGWKHLIWARQRFNSALDVQSYPHGGTTKRNSDYPFGWTRFDPMTGPWDYEHCVEFLNTDVNRAHIFEERFFYKRWETYDMDTTRQSFWRYTMAGGVGSWWGHYEYDRGYPYPYPNPEQLTTHYKFWTENKRFLIDMQRDNGITDGYCLRNVSKKNYVFYKEKTSSIKMNLSGMSGSQKAIAIDTKLTYAEINIGTRSAVNHKWNAPYVSDWAIAVGTFNGAPSTTSSKDVLVQQR